MPIPQLNVFRHDHESRALLTLAGEIDAATAPLVREALEACHRDGVRRVDVDLTAVTFCDVSGLNVFLSAFLRQAETGTTLRLHRPSQGLARVIEITGSGFLLHAVPPGTDDRGPVAVGAAVPVRRKALVHAHARTRTGSREADRR